MSAATYRRLSNAMHACIETGNDDEARLTLKLAREAFHAKQLTLQEMADIGDDFHTHFDE